MRPTEPHRLLGNRPAIDRMRTWIEAWTKDRRTCGKTKVLLLHGPPGCGKTTAAHVILKSFGYTVSEINASSVTYSHLKDWFGVTAMAARGLVNRDQAGKQRRIAVLLDEVDGLCRGGNADDDDWGREFDWMWRIVDNPRRTAPIVCTCNDRYMRRMRAICKRSVIVDFRRLTTTDLIPLARQTATALKIDIILPRILQLIKRANGDARALVNDIELDRFGATRTTAIRNQAPSDFDACRWTLCGRCGSAAQFTTPSTGLRFLWKNMLLALAETSCSADTNERNPKRLAHKTDGRRCDAAVIALDAFAVIDTFEAQTFSLGFDRFFRGVLAELVALTFSAACGAAKLGAPRRRQLGKLEFPHPRELSISPSMRADSITTAIAAYDLGPQAVLNTSYLCTRPKH